MNALPTTLDEQVEQWRHYLGRRPGVAASDVDELTDHLLTTVDDLTGRGLAADEAFLVAVKRLGAQDELAHAFAAEHSDRLWKQLVVNGAGPTPAPGRPAGLAAMLGFAAVAGLMVALPLQAMWTSADSGADAVWLPVLVSLLGVTAVVAGWFWWQRRPVPPTVAIATVVALAVFGVAGTLYPFAPSGMTLPLFLLHTPIVLGIVLGASYLGRDWRRVDRWMDYIRFTGELFIYFVLIALGGGVLVGLTAAIFSFVGIDAMTVLAEWVVPLGAGGALVVSAWLVEAKKAVIENIAPVLTAVFTPLFTLVMLAFLAALAVTGNPVEADRGLLIAVDLLLVVVLALLVFSVSARPTDAGPRLQDWSSVALLVAALAVDAVVGFAIAGRIAEYGTSANKLAAVGENVVLAVSLAVSLWLYVGFLRGRRPFVDVERWQVRYLPVVAAWAGLVALAFPVAFGFA